MTASEASSGCSCRTASAPGRTGLDAGRSWRLAFGARPSHAKRLTAARRILTLHAPLTQIDGDMQLGPVISLHAAPSAAGAGTCP